MMNKEHSESTGQKREYLTPLLIRYGELRDLTKGGAGSQYENQGKDSQLGKKPTASDRSLKENILRIGEHPLGIGLYLFDYKPEFRDQWGHGRQFGVMAQEVEMVMPKAISMHPDGYKAVDYGMLGIGRTDH